MCCRQKQNEPLEEWCNFQMNCRLYQIGGFLARWKMTIVQKGTKVTFFINGILIIETLICALCVCTFTTISLLLFDKQNIVLLDDFCIELIYLDHKYFWLASQVWGLFGNKLLPKVMAFIFLIFRPQLTKLSRTQSEYSFDGSYATFLVFAYIFSTRW